MKNQAKFVLIVYLLILGCKKDITIPCSQSGNCDFRDTLVGDFSSTIYYNHVVLDSLGNFTYVTDYTYNYPIVVSRFGEEDLKLRFGNIPDTFTRTYIFEHNYIWSYGNYDLQFFSKDSFQIYGHTNSSTTRYNAKRMP